MRSYGMARVVSGGALLLVTVLRPIGLSAQSAVLSVSAASITSGERGSCTLKMDKVTAAPGDGKLFVRFTDTASKAAKIAAPAIVQINGRDVKTYAIGDTGNVITLGDTLLNATVSVVRSDARESLCDVVTWPLSPQLAPHTPTYTAFAADGEIGKVLRGGTSSNLSGSLGMEHRILHRGWGPSSNVLWQVLRGLLPFTAQGEEARAFITIAGTADTLNSSGQSSFGAAVLDPKLSGSGFLDGATIEYYPFSPVNSQGGTWGPLLKATIARSLWRIVDTTSAPGATLTADTVTRALPLTAIDLGFRFVFINHLDDAKGNTYSMGFDPRFIWRGVSPNTGRDSLVINKGLGQNVRWSSGEAIAMWMRLRTVTASADILYLHRKKRGEPVDGLTGLQSLVKFSYSSWLFVF
jgi:hypothetical protein